MPRCGVVYWAIFGMVWALSGALPDFAQRAASADGRGVIVVWTVGSPATGDTPDAKVPGDLENRAEGIGLRLQIQAFPAKVFAQEFFDAFNAHHEPDVIAFDNASVIEARRNNPYGQVGIASDPAVRKSLVQVTGAMSKLTGGPAGGWQFLISTSKNYEAARRLALLPPECGAGGVSGVPINRDVQEAAVQMADAYLRAPGEMSMYNDADRLIGKGVRQESMKALATRICGSWGNDRLLFVSTVSTYEPSDPDEPVRVPSILAGTHKIGQMPVLLVLRKHDAQWRLLAASSDPMSNGPFLRQIPAISHLMQGVGIEETGPAPAQLLSPGKPQLPLPEAVQRVGDYTWQPSTSDNVMAEILEFAYQNDARLFLKLARDDIARDQVWEGPPSWSGSEWKLRVWSISDSGAIAFSEVRSFRH